MAELPKIVRERLRQRHERGPAELDLSGPLAESFKAGVHPDANLLAAFAEQALTGSERALMISHLADCAQCRELVALTFPSPDVQAALAETGGAAEGRPARLRLPAWLGWRALRWGVLAASLGVVFIGAFQTGLLRWPASPKREASIAENKRSSILTAPSGSSPSATGQASTPASPRPAVTYRAGLKAKSDRQGIAAASEAGIAKRAPQAGGTRKSGAADAFRAPLTAPVLKVPPAKTEQASSKERDENRRAHRPSPPQSKPVPFNGFAAPSDSPQGEKASRLPQQKSLGLQQVEVRAEAAPEKKTEPAASPASRPPQNNLSVVTQALAPPPASPPRPASPGQAGRAGGLYNAPALAKALAPRWSISSVAGPTLGGIAGAPRGRVERSLDGGKTWQELRVDDRVSFRVMFADGPEVWAGGSGGALYHSTDGGERWGRVRVGSDQDVVADTIVGINVPDPLHVAVTTDAHETWVTADGGRHWQER